MLLLLFLRLETVLKLEMDLSVSATEEGWLQMDVNKAIEHWRQDPTDEMVLYMEIIDSQGKSCQCMSVLVCVSNGSGVLTRDAHVEQGWVVVIRSKNRLSQMCTCVRVRVCARAGEEQLFC